MTHFSSSPRPDLIADAAFVFEPEWIACTRYDGSPEALEVIGLVGRDLDGRLLVTWPEQPTAVDVRTGPREVPARLCCPVPPAMHAPLAALGPLLAMAMVQRAQEGVSGRTAGVPPEELTYDAYGFMQQQLALAAGVDPPVAVLPSRPVAETLAKAFDASVRRGGPVAAATHSHRVPPTRNEVAVGLELIHSAEWRFQPVITSACTGEEWHTHRQASDRYRDDLVVVIHL